jgi:imidazolonepropionase-like amidohydrolase
LAGPRYLANAKEIAPPDGALIAAITAFASGPEEMKKVVQQHIDTGVDQIKLSMSGEEITERLHAEDTTFTDDEVKACVELSHAAGKRVCGHARSAESVKQCVKYGVDIIYHASYIDEEGMDMLEKAKDKHWVAVYEPFSVRLILAGHQLDRRHFARCCGVWLSARKS